MIYSLAMHVEVLSDGRVSVEADWLDEPVVEATFADAYWEAMRLRTHGRRSCDQAAE